MSAISKSNLVRCFFVALFASLVLSACVAASAFADEGVLRAGLMAEGVDKAVVQTDQSTPLKAAAKAKAIAKQQFTLKTNIVNKKATTVKKGKTNLVMKKGPGYMKFTAPKTKIYSFTFSNIKCSAPPSIIFITAYKTHYLDAQTLSSRDAIMKTKGGQTDTLWLGVNGYTAECDNPVDSRLAKRTGKIKLSKGETIYFYFYGESGKYTFQLNVK